jgi:hypothetical protein
VGVRAVRFLSCPSVRDWAGNLPAIAGDAVAEAIAWVAIIVDAYLGAGVTRVAQGAIEVGAYSERAAVLDEVHLAQGFACALVNE